MKGIFAPLIFVVLCSTTVAAGRLERTAILVLPDEVSYKSAFRAQVEIRWDDDSPLRITTWAMKQGESTLGEIQIFDEHGKKVQMFFPMSLPLTPSGERVIRKGEVARLGLYFMGWPSFERGGSYYAIAAFSSASCDGRNVRFITRKRWFRVSEHAARRAGATRLSIVGDPHAEGFYRRMGAIVHGKEPAPMDGEERYLPLLAKAL